MYRHHSSPLLPYSPFAGHPSTLSPQVLVILFILNNSAESAKLSAFLFTFAVEKIVETLMKLLGSIMKKTKIACGGIVIDKLCAKCCNRYVYKQLRSYFTRLCTRIYGERGSAISYISNR